MAHICKRNFTVLFLTTDLFIWIRIPLKFVPGNPFDNKISLVPVKAWYSVVPPREPKMIQLTHPYDLNELDQLVKC